MPAALSLADAARRKEGERRIRAAMLCIQQAKKRVAETAAHLTEIEGGSEAAAFAEELIAPLHKGFGQVSELRTRLVKADGPLSKKTETTLGIGEGADAKSKDR